MKTTIGVDLGGTTIGAVLISETGETLWEKNIQTRREEGYEAVVARITGLIEVAKAFGTLAGIGVGVPGPVDRVTGRVYECVNLSWGEVDLAGDLSCVTGIPSMLMNDASAAAYGEFAAGSLRGVMDGLMLTLGTGVGGGAIIGGHLFEGRHGLGMEVGHMVVGEGDYRCSCGRMGCFETYTSASGLIMNAHAQLAEHGPSTWLDARLSIDGRVIMDGAQSGDSFCEAVVNRWIHYLAIGVLDLRMVFDPEVIAFGGGLSNAGAFWLPKLEQVITHSANFRNIPLPKLVLAELGEKAGAIGAAHRVMEVISEKSL
jgi:glucokinase